MIPPLREIFVNVLLRRNDLPISIRCQGESTPACVAGLSWIRHLHFYLRSIMTSCDASMKHHTGDVAASLSDKTHFTAEAAPPQIRWYVPFRLYTQNWPRVCKRHETPTFLVSLPLNRFNLSLRNHPAVHPF